MSKIISILHIADLHRSQAFHISNTVLINSLEKDLERYANGEDIPKPSLIVVSGDIISGKGTKEEIYEQYEEAYVFLCEITDSFLDGNKEKIIIVPGNHDMNWYYSKTSMNSLPLNSNPDEKLKQKKDYYRLLKQDILMRWSWETFEFLRITDQVMYDKRMEEFVEFYERFYEGKRKYSLDSMKQYDIFDYPEFNLTVVGFNSCFRNDHCNLEGKINPDCIANVTRTLRQSKYNGRFLMTVWHHNTTGRPNDNNYMSSTVLQHLIESGFSLGFHGHQHKQDIVYEDFKLNSQKKMVVISSGSLCAGPDELPVGETRNYNIVKIDIQNLQLDVHVRKMLGDSFDSPIWVPSTTINNISINQPQQTDIDNESFGIQKMLEVDELIKKTDYEQALSILEKLSFENDLVRYLSLECFFHTKRHKEIIQYYMPPRSKREFIYLIDAIIAERDKDAILALSKINIDEQLKDSAVKEEYDKLHKRVIMWK